MRAVKPGNLSEDEKAVFSLFTDEFFTESALVINKMQSVDGNRDGKLNFQEWMEALGKLSLQLDSEKLAPLFNSVAKEELLGIEPFVGEIQRRVWAM